MIIAPMPSNVPEVHEPEYQFQLPPVPKLPPLMESIEELPGHTEDGLEDAVVAIADTV